MADESKHFHYYYNIGCKWRYKQMRYFQCKPKQNPIKLRGSLDRICKSISHKNEFSNFDLNNNEITQSSSDNTYCCDYMSCQKIYKSWFQLQRHRSLHYNKSQNKPYFCDWTGCQNQFKKLKNLIIHRRLHTGERPFKCDYENCNKGFRAAHSLSSHRRTHKENFDKISEYEKPNKK